MEISEEVLDKVNEALNVALSVTLLHAKGQHPRIMEAAHALTDAIDESEDKRANELAMLRGERDTLRASVRESIRQVGEYRKRAEDLAEKQSARLEEARLDGVSSVRTIRCVEHRVVPQMNATESEGGECAVCAVLVARNHRGCDLEAECWIECECAVCQIKA